jgi:uncharacterized repeat protein (TIGR03803 family)
MTQSGVLAKLHRFDSTDAAGSISLLIQGADGDLYGTAFAGGNFAGACSDIGCGTVFKMTPSGKLTTLYNFAASPTARRGCGLSTRWRKAETETLTVPRGKGELTTSAVYKTSSTGAHSVIYDFCSESNCTDGQILFGSGSARTATSTGQRTTAEPTTAARFSKSRRRAR